MMLAHSVHDACRKASWCLKPWLHHGSVQCASMHLMAVECTHVLAA